MPMASLFEAEEMTSGAFLFAGTFITFFGRSGGFGVSGGFAASFSALTRAEARRSATIVVVMMTPMQW